MKCVEAMEEERVEGVVIPERSVGESFWVRDFERSFKVLLEMIVNV